MTTSRSLLTAPSVSFRTPFAQAVHRSGGGGELGAVLSYRPPARGAVDGERGPTLAVLAGQVDQQCPVVVFDAAAVRRIPDLVQHVGRLGVGDERTPPARHVSRRS